MTHNEISGQVVDAALEVHRTLGPGLLESIYEAALAHELRSRGFQVEAQVPVAVIYKGVELDIGFRLDLLVEDCVVVELKSVARVEPVHSKQLLTYLKLSEKHLGLLINFNEPLLKNGLTRLVNGL